ncbi:hypothetical protein A3860_19020 [Niastella vici]|uniref:CHAT domain-containing protein n=1 Tax=Niastella vici TaxID=1703345 RepID=A0A1V9G2W3_9BACT|nr:CHAT domain-containing tetratricopeptide repeat protein [Niastella vici]OQP64848.1 hypothetical protein A3860_19020 [Niastella vici]
MNRCLYKVVILILFQIAVPACWVYASPDSLALPASLTKKLANYKKHDDLDFWIYERMMYVEKDPPARIGFLMRSQQEAWRTYKTYYERMAWFDLLSVQGYYQLQTGNILASINAYETALSFYESYPLPDADIIETVLKPLGNNYTRLADYNTALFIHRKTMELAMKTNNKDLIASTYSNMAICSRSQDDLLTAAGYCTDGLRYASPATPLYGLLLSTQADILTAQHQYDSAESICNTALKKLQQYHTETTALYWYAGALQVAAKIAMEKHRFQQAAGYAERALQLFKQHFTGTRQREKAKLYVQLGDINCKTGNGSRALEFYQNALLLLIPTWSPASISTVPGEQLLYSENTFSDALCGKAAAFMLLHQPQEALQQYTGALVATGKLRREFFYAESKLKEIINTRSGVEAATKLAYTLWIQTGDRKYLEQLLLITEQSRAQVLMDERRSRMVTGTSLPGDTVLRRAAQLKQVILYYQHELLSTKNKETVTALLQQAEYDLSILNKKIKQQAGPNQYETGLTEKKLYAIMQQIPERVTMLEFVAASDSSFIIELNNKGIQSVQLITASRELHADIPRFMQQWFANGPSAMINEPGKFYKECYHIYQSIFKTRSWQKDRHYVLIPDGPFSYLPFDALLTDPVYQNNFSQWPYLLKKASLSQAFSLTTWYEQQNANYPSAGFTGFFVSKGQQTKQAVLSIETEFRELNKKIAGRYYTNSAATWEAFNNAVTSTGILHISTHAVSSVLATEPYLQLYDKPFYLFDLRYKHFTPALVVLSACKTADGNLLVGEGLNSLSRGFTAAGAGGVMAGLWNVNDKTAIALTQLFYEQLSKQNDIALALHHAKKQWLLSNKDNALVQLPYYWAAFVYSGHLKKIQVPAVQSTRRYYWFLALLLIPGAVYVYSRLNRKKNSPTQ